MSIPSCSIPMLSLVLTCALLVDCADAAIETTIEESSIISSEPDGNYNNDTFLYVGHLDTHLDGTGPHVGRAYLKFQLPAHVTGTQITSATLHGIYDHPHPSNNDYGPLSWYLAASDSWSEHTLTWNNQPGTTGTQIATWHPPSSTSITPWTYDWDITATVNQEYLTNDGLLSLVLKVDNEDEFNNWHYFLEHNSFELEFTVEAINGVVPEATSFLTWGLLALTGVGTATGRRWRIC